MGVFVDLVKFLVPAITGFMGAVVAAAIYSWRLSGVISKLTSGIEAVSTKLTNETDRIHAAIAADNRVRDERDMRIHSEHKHDLAVLRKDLDSLTARVAALEAAPRKP